MSAPLLEVRDLQVWLAGRGGAALHALRGIDLRLDRGECLALIGESGSGKTLTALAVMGLLPDGARATGRIALDGRELLALDEDDWCGLRGRRVAMVFQEPLTALNPLQRVLAQVMEPIRLHRLAPDRASARQRALALLARVGLEERQACAYPHQLSGGQRQRALIAMALAAEPELLIADEPTTALDARLRVQVLELLRELVAERGMGLLLISHDLALTARRVDRLLILYGGRVMEQGVAADLLAHPRHPYTQALWAARPRLGAGRDQPLHPLKGNVPALAQLGDGCPFAPRCPLATARCAAEPPRFDGRLACWEVST
ncbi:peptide/nickel transport system ATP-binding protein [Mitsuaria sp. PDC51]|jgi:peptide/nickel transport system ATP-binding protein|uniref:ABC transporter ATP-binding protein n=1 Tax=unclassified Roseateles TaxID=2626991 RepID=UPI0008EAE274|nr:MULTISPECIES: ABC transporter ATP-binding protein [unclassified Roseateles]MBB3295643.1 peptide/nickel transport system ATP-binding protein [Mitsuaria sp. BK041]MBB3364859.1 peptide/nickel transport system ATP-binding protein [Mitsuaria sp. BK045]SFR93158.1 peptide/nickel transport system ATP-binding protein [Mitsuaria sp. PDC51]